MNRVTFLSRCYFWLCLFLVCNNYHSVVGFSSFDAPGRSYLISLQHNDMYVKQRLQEPLLLHPFQTPTRRAHVFQYSSSKRDDDDVTVSTTLSENSKDVSELRKSITITTAITSSSTSVDDKIKNEDEDLCKSISTSSQFLPSNNPSITRSDSLSEDSLYESHNPEQGTITMMTLLFLVGSLSSLDRVAMSVALVPMSNDYHGLLTDTVKGSISSFFSVGYGLGIVPAGLILSQSQFSPRLIMVMGIACWSLGTIATPLLIDQTTLLLVARMAVGMSESVVIPTVQRLLSVWIPLDKKSVAVATIFGGFQSGTILAYAISPAIIDAFDGNWRSIFFVYGGVGLLFLIPWWMLAQDAPPSPLATMEEKRSQTRPADDPKPILLSSLSPSKEVNMSSAFETTKQIFKEAPWIDFVSSKATWGMFLAHAANNWGLYNNLSWTPTFYAERYGLNVKESAWLLILPSIVGLTGGLVSASIADEILRRQQGTKDGKDQDTMAPPSVFIGTTRVRRIFQGLASLGPALCFATLAKNIVDSNDTPVISQSLLAVAVGLQSFNAAGYGAANQEKAGPKYTGLLYSVTSLPSVIIGTIGVQCTGWILDATHQNWSIVFALTAMVYVVGATAFVTLYNSQQEFE
jgi:MFS transporter, ACS family, solute carrier family 17 (sodium-dependent inorganic phosphate cotransporter), other